MRNKGLTGEKAKELLEAVNITTNKNTISFAPESSFVTSGIRIGNPSVTTRGMKEEDMKRIAEIIDLALDENNDREEIRAKVIDLCNAFPL